MKQILYLTSILMITISCKGQSQDCTEIEGNRVSFTKEQSHKYLLPELPFSIVVPEGFEYELNPKSIGAIRVYKKIDDSTVTEISVAISAFDAKYSIEQEKIWLQEFKNRPDIANNPDFEVTIYNDYLILNEKRNFYAYSLNNDHGRYPINTPINSVGITYPTDDGLKGLAIVVSKWSIDLNEPLTEIEKGIINSIRYE